MRTVVFVVFDDLQLLDLAGPVDVLTELTGPLTTDRERPAEVVERFRALPPDRYPRLIVAPSSTARSMTASTSST